MSKKDQLGGGRFGNTQTRPVSARRQAVAEATGVATTGAPDSRLQTLPLEQLVPTRFNPRRNFGTDEDLKEFGRKLEVKQLQPAVAVTREAYLKLWEEEADAVGTHRYVIANGERRFRASQAAGLGTLEVIVDDTLAASRATFLDAVLSENNDREDLDPVEQAIGIQTMVEQLGGKARVAEHFGKSAGWVTQQLYLLKLAPELQDLVSAGVLPVRETRDLVKLPVEEQATAWANRLAARAEEKLAPADPVDPQRDLSPPAPTAPVFTAVKNPQTEPPTAPPQPAQPTPVFTAVKNPQTDSPTAPTAPTEPAQPAPGFTAVKNEGAEPAPRSDVAHAAMPSPPPATTPETVPEPRAHELTERDTNGHEADGKKFPYDSGAMSAHLLIRKMETDEEFFKMVDILVATKLRKRPAI
ncbi:ParB/RepB/Spo0J family partition protein [Streptomyces sp. NBC_01445]|uniref:ParB/RepB/Spo0J family partition protein n=1 Tax=Streptomyces sp. NBC_01445 TaxID=2903869 RepID=UPI002DD91985|nr:ParB/RepB/Spo0J family partition protein [Streptomyces sp. NBC_01445]WSE11801.1 ParB/RepB/Spo0J family partition protein [Streptomyces sp. NBC_01445]